MNDPFQPPVEENTKSNWLPWLAVGAVIVFVIVGFAFAARFIYALGQRNAAQVAGIDLTPQSTITPTVDVPPTITPTITLTPTATQYVVFPTATATKIPWTSCPGIVITVTDTKKGDIVHVQRCSDNFLYDIGPLARGFYAVSPDDKYLVYCTTDGILYAAKIGSPTLQLIMNVKREGEFTVFNKKVDPLFVMTFTETPQGLVLEIYEKNYNQNMPIVMPRWLDE